MSSQLLNALWIPAWHELDQPLALGEENRFYFFDETPAQYRPWVQASERVFFNLDELPEDPESVVATPIEIQHETLGHLLRIDTFGLDYIFYPANAEEWIVDAEESPGTCRTHHECVEHWRVHVKLELTPGHRDQ